MSFYTLLLELAASPEDGTRLHASNFGEGITETATTVPEHWVLLVELFDASCERSEINAHSFCHLLLLFYIVGYELMERGVEKTYRYGQALHYFEDLIEVFALVRQDLFECFYTTLFVFGEDHLTHGFDLFCFEEHVLCTAETDTYGTKVASRCSVARRVCIGANLEACVLIGKRHQGAEVVVHFSSNGGYFAEEYFPRSSIDRDLIAFVENGLTDGKRALYHVHHHFAGTGDTAFTHTTSHYGSVRGHTPTCCEDTLRGCHTFEVFGRSLLAYDDYFLAFCVPSGSVVGKEYNLPRCSTGRCRETLC